MDIPGSGFRSPGTTVSPNLGGDEALAGCGNVWERAALRLMLDFVPNHMAPDHPWIDSTRITLSMQRGGFGSLTAELLRVQRKTGRWCSLRPDPYLEAGPTPCSLTTGTRPCRKP